MTALHTLGASRTLALDVGNRRIGVAISDELGITAQPLLTLHRGAPRADLRSLERLVRRYAVGTVIVGLPLHASGDDSAQAAVTRTFAAQLRAHLAATLPAHGLAVPAMEFVDERHTTADAHALLDAHGAAGGRAAAGRVGAAGGHSAARRAREARTAVIDQAAATLILAAWLAHTRGPALLPDPDAT